MPRATGMLVPTVAARACGETLPPCRRASPGSAPPQTSSLSTRVPSMSNRTADSGLGTPPVSQPAAGPAGNRRVRPASAAGEHRRPLLQEGRDGLLVVGGREQPGELPADPGVQ